MEKSASKIEAEIDHVLRACSLESRGLWTDMRYRIEHESDRPGHLQRNGQPINQRQLANIAGCPCETVARLLQELTESGLVSESGGVFHSKPLSQLFQLRDKVAARKRRQRERERVGGRDVTPDVTTHVTGDVTPKPPPPSSSSLPTPLSSTPPTHPLPFSNENGAGGVTGGGGGGNGSVPKPAAKKRERVLTDAQDATRKAFADWWRLEAYPRRHHGVPYEFGAVDGTKVLEVLRHPGIAWDLAKAKAAADVFLGQSDLYFQDHTLLLFRKHLGRMLTQLAALAKGIRHEPTNGHRHPRTPNRPGEFNRPLPSAARSLDDDIAAVEAEEAAGAAGGGVEGAADPGLRDPVARAAG